MTHLPEDIIEPDTFDGRTNAWRYISRINGRIAFLSDEEHRAGYPVALAIERLNVVPAVEAPEPSGWEQALQAAIAEESA